MAAPGPRHKEFRAHMDGSTGVMAVILLEAAVGGSLILWASGVWGVVRRGFFLLTGLTVAVCAAGTWAIAASQDAGGRVELALAVFTLATVLSQAALASRLATAGRVIGVAAVPAGVWALVETGLLRANAAAAIAELALGALFLGSTLYGLLLGHWYLVERRLDKRYMVQGAWWYIAGVGAAAGAALLSAGNPPPDIDGLSPFLAFPGFTLYLAAGLVAICALIGGFVWKLAHEGGRSIQAATGYFYLAVIMAFAAEMSTKVRFF